MVEPAEVAVIKPLAEMQVPAEMEIGDVAAAELAVRQQQIQPLRDLVMVGLVL